MACRLVLWDIDGTLLHAGEIGARVFDLAIERALGRPPETRVVMSGKTDPQIAREFLTEMVDDPDVVLPLVLKHLEMELAEAAEQIALAGRPCPGVELLLGYLHNDPLVHQSVLTGNLTANALVKLAAFGLDRYLDLECGAYGSDAEDRCELVPIARQRHLDRRGLAVDTDEIWIIGDSPRDLECARAGGVHCLLVGTGRFSVGELAPLGADAALADLSDLVTVLGVLGVAPLN